MYWAPIDGRAITPTSFNMASEIDAGTVSECFSYDSEHARTQMDTRASGCGGSLTSSTIYLNDPASGATSEKFVAGSTVTWRDYVASDDGLIGIRFCTGASPCTSGATQDYVVSDQIGSVSVLTAASGSLIERDSYDAWGQRRNPDGSDAASCNSIASATTKGFTRQEHVDVLCLINYNARFYDPTIGRFLSADPVTATPYDLQVLNKYSYVLNSPLEKTDPTGNDASGSGGPGNTCSRVGGSDCSGSYSGDGTTAQRIGADGELGGIRRTGEVLVHLMNQTTNSSTARSDASTGGTNGDSQVAQNQGSVTYKKGIPAPSAAVDRLMKCTATCTGDDIEVTSTSEGHKAGDPHTQGLAADFKIDPHSSADKANAMICAATCGAKFQKDEYAHPSPNAVGSGHIHVQLRPGLGGATGPYYPLPTPIPRPDDAQQ